MYCGQEEELEDRLKETSSCVEDGILLLMFQEMRSLISDALDIRKPHDLSLQLEELDEEGNTIKRIL